MATKIITLRLPRTSYDTLAGAAAVAGLPLSVYLSARIDRAEIAATLESLAAEIRSHADTRPLPVPAPAPSREREILLLVRTMAAHLNPQIPQAVAARLRAEAEGRK